MWSFKKKQQDADNLPQEVQDYYQAEKRERSGVAWLLALGTLLITIALALGLFFGGRWAYRAIFQNDPSTPAENADSNDDPINGLPGISTIGEENQVQPNEADEPNPAPTPQPAESDDNNSARQLNDTASNQSQADTQKSSEELPDTGPGSTLAIFLATVAVAYVLHYSFAGKARQ